MTMADEQQVATGTNDSFNMEGAVADIAADLGISQDASSGSTPPPPTESGATVDGDEQAAGEAAAPSTPAEDQPQEAAAAEQKPASSSTDGEPPGTWSPEARELWGTLPERARQEILKREGDVLKGIGQYKQALDTYSGMLAPYRHIFERDGAPQVLIPRMLQAFDTLQRGTPEHKVNAFRQLAAEVGIDISKLGQEGTAAVTGEGARVLQEVRQLQQGLTNVAAEMQNARLKEMEQSVVAFAQDEKAHPYFWEVAMDMKRLLDRNAVDTMEEAYTLACKNNPIVYAKLVKAEAQALAEANAKKAAEKAVEAKKASSVNIRARGAGRAPKPVGSFEDTLNAAYDAIEARG
jgi:hypothetical protein